MPDVFTKAKCSQVMSRIRGHGNKDTELALVKLFRRHGITGWRRNQKVFGKPDFIFRQLRLALFVDGCFWHGCPRHCKTPAGNRAFWKRKLTTNKTRDLRVSRVLRKNGWRVMRIWEHDLAKRGEASVRRIQAATNLKRGNDIVIRGAPPENPPPAAVPGAVILIPLPFIPLPQLRRSAS
jgi:DNA mismatch endonuclease (patch repair protein)